MPHYITRFLTSLHAELLGIDQTTDELKTLSEDRHNHILKTRQRIIRALCEKVCIWSNGQVKLYGLLDGSEASEKSWSFHGRTERLLDAHKLDENGGRWQRIGYLPKDAPRQIGECLATLHRPEGQRRIEGNLSLLRPQPALKGYVDDRRA